MKIAGLNKTTLLDYPEQVAATVFTVGCNFCCPFCHNVDLVTGQAVNLISEEEVLIFLKERRGILTGVCITGGEPTLQPGLKEFLHKVKGMGYSVKLDTNGSRPDVVRELLKESLLDYIAMDVKNSRDKYAMTVGRADIDRKEIEESVDLIKHSGISYEFRTTVVKEFHTEEDLMGIGEWIAGERIAEKKIAGEWITRKKIAEKGIYYLQTYEENEHVIRKGLHPYSAEIMHGFAEKLTERGIPAITRGIE